MRYRRVLRSGITVIPVKGEAIAVALSEVRNIPIAIKELAIVFTPSVILSFLLCLAAVRRRRKSLPTQYQIALLVALNAITLVLSYCMFVFY